MLLHIRPLARHFSQYTRLTVYEQMTRRTALVASTKHRSRSIFGAAFASNMNLRLHILFIIEPSTSQKNQLESSEKDLLPPTPARGALQHNPKRDIEFSSDEDARRRDDFSHSLSTKAPKLIVLRFY